MSKVICKEKLKKEIYSKLEKFVGQKNTPELQEEVKVILCEYVTIGKCELCECHKFEKTM